VEPWLFNVFETVLFMGMFFLTIQFLIPKAIRHFRLWKSAEKDAHLTNFIGISILSFFLLSAVFVMFIQVFIKMVGR